MERYTKKNYEGNGYHLICSGSCVTLNCGDCGILDKIVDRLATLEDILGDDYALDRLRELAQADRDERCVVLDMPRKPLVWGNDEQNTCLCPDCGKDLMGLSYGERMVLQCPECGQYLDAAKAVFCKEAETAPEGKDNAIR